MLTSRPSPHVEMSAVVLRSAPRLLREALLAVEPQSPPEPAPHELYARVVLRDTPEMLITAAGWRAGSKSVLHGHGSSAALYRIVSGTIEEERFVPSAGKFACATSMLTAGDESYLPHGVFHQLRACTDAVTLHVYSPRPENTVAELTNGERALVDEARRATASHRTLSRIPPSRYDHREIESLARELAPAWGQHEQGAVAQGSNRLPLRIVEDMRATGILSAPLPRRLGGMGASLFETAKAVSHIAEFAPSAALALAMPLGNAATCRIPLSAVLPEYVRCLRANQSWIAEQVLRGRIIAVANSEPDAGANLSQTQTIAEIGADGITRLTGRKTFATIGSDSDYVLCAARRTDSREPNSEPLIDGFFVWSNAPGVTINNGWNGFGMRTTASGSVTLHDAPADALLGYPGCLQAVNARHWSTLLFSAVFLGIGRAAVREGIRNGGRSPSARAKLAERFLALEAAAGFLESVCRSETWPMPRPLLDSVQRVKTFVTQASVQAAVESAMLSGGRCYAMQHPIYRLLADSLAGPCLRPPLAQAMDSLSAQLEDRLGNGS